MNVIKYPLPFVASAAPIPNGASGGMTISDIQNEKAQLNADLDKKRIECTDAKHTKYERQACEKDKNSIREQLEVLNSNPSNYLAYTQKLMAEKMLQASRNQDVSSANDKKFVTQQEQRQFFLTNGGMMTKPPGSSFATTSEGETYFKPEGSAFSYGTGTNSGKTCFHYGNFADCN